MDSKLSLYFPVIFLMILFSTLAGCSGNVDTAVPLATSLAVSEATSTPQFLSPTATITASPSPVPSVTSTPENLPQEFDFTMQDIVLVYESDKWQRDEEDGRLLHHASLDGCSFVIKTGSEYNPAAPAVVIGGYTWLKSTTSAGNSDFYVLMLSNQATGVLLLQFGNDVVVCEQAGEALLATLQFSSSYSNAGKCTNAPPIRLQIGGQARLLSQTYLRNAPLWSEETQVRLLDPGEGQSIEVLRGPVCVLNAGGETANWQVQFANGESGWLAEGDLYQYYLQPVN